MSRKTEPDSQGKRRHDGGGILAWFSSLSRGQLVQIIVALIGLVGALLAAAIPILPEACSGPSTRDYQVRVRAKDTGEPLPNAEVALEIAGIAPLREVTDANGLARFRFPASHAGDPGRLIIDAAGYERYEQNVDLLGDLPQVIQLNPER